MTDTSPTSAWLEQERQALNLVEEALDQPPEQARGWVVERTEGRPDVRERTLELLQQAHNTPTNDVFGLSESTVPKAELSVGPTRSIDPRAPSISPSLHSRGQQIGSYRIDEEIGRGGMGVVYRAHRSDDTFELAVALKVMQALPGQAAQRFEAERRILALLDHPNIARILDGGHTDEGAPYLVMELVEGETIDRFCDRQLMPLRGRIELFLQVCKAVLHAHHRLVVHRDLKPGNILVTSDGQPKLLDFGIAKLLDLDQPDATLTQFGLGAMTPEYASPEQVRHEPITVSSDVYSLGVILYQLLVGRRPYQLENRSPRNIERVVCDSQPPRPSNLFGTLDQEAETTVANLRATSGERLERELTGDLDAIILSALEKDPADRYGSVEEFADDLERFLEGKPVKARPQTWAYLARRFLARNKRQVAITAVVLVTTIGGLTVGVIQSLRAGAEGRKALIEAEKLKQTNLFLDSLFTSPDPMWGMGKETKVGDLLDVAVERLQKGDPVDDASAVLRTIGATYRNLGEIEKSVEVLELAERESLRKYGPDSVETALSRQRLANSVSDLGEGKRTVELIEAALPVLERANHPDLPIVLSQYATALVDIGEPEKADKYFRLTLDRIRQKEVKSLDDVISLNNYAVFLMQHDHSKEADPLFREALATHRSLEQAPSPLTASILANIAGLAQLNGDFQEAEKRYLESIEICDDLLGEDHPQTMTTRAGLIDLYSAAGRLEDAEPLANSLLKRATATLPEGHPILAFAQVVHAGVRIRQGFGEQVEAELRSAIATRKASLPAGHWLVASAESMLGASLLAQGRRAEAEPLLKTSYETLRNALGEEHTATQRAAGYLRELRGAEE